MPFDNHCDLDESNLNKSLTRNKKQGKKQEFLPIRYTTAQKATFLFISAVSTGLDVDDCGKGKTSPHQYTDIKKGVKPYTK